MKNPSRMCSVIACALLGLGPATTAPAAAVSIPIGRERFCDSDYLDPVQAQRRIEWCIKCGITLSEKLWDALASKEGGYPVFNVLVPHDPDASCELPESVLGKLSLQALCWHDEEGCDDYTCR